MDSVTALLDTLNTLSPLAVIALLGVVIFFLVKGRGEVQSIASNHLSGLPEILETLQRIEVKLGEDLAWIKAKLNGHRHD